MKIGIVCYPTYGGSGVVASELGKGLAEAGHLVHFITYKKPARLVGFQDNLFYHEVGNFDYPLFEYAPYDSMLASKLVDVIKYEKLDILHVHYAIPHAIVAYIAKMILESQGYQIPVLTTLHGTDITLVGSNPSFAPVVEFSLNRSEGITAVSSSLKEDTLSQFTVNTPIDVIPNFIDFNRFSRTDKDHFKTAIAPENEKILIHTSNFRKVKRVQDVIEVFDQVQQKIPAKLLLIGDGPERESLEQLCREKGICSDIRFLGKQDAVEELLAIGDLFIIPSESESFGLAALEAMAVEVPVISSNTGGLPEVNLHGKTGFTSNVGDVDDMASNALKLLQNDELLEEFRANALAQAQTFDLKNIMPQYIELYERLINEKKALA